MQKYPLLNNNQLRRKENASFFHRTDIFRNPPPYSRKKNSRQTNHLIHGNETGLHQQLKNRGRKKMRCGNKLPSPPPRIVWSRDLTTYDVITLTICPTLRESNERRRKDVGRKNVGRVKKKKAYPKGSRKMGHVKRLFH
ncbi:hypothetical protein CEXT_599361 [Caerostris extrusa]|uniref:Uncharacterized protein n=1 Tax=Caerostris extrusa TaxID=172846 RepID=A0AAV4P7J8_CAEEX|nr:hypothetical protein CEXT_599361 [Caerostris extrusa]